METILKLKDIKKQFGKTVVLDGVNLDINKGERLVIIGPNGSGKSTLIDVITSIKKPDVGSIEYLGFKDSLDLKRVIGVQFQQNGLPSGFRTKELIDLMFEVNYDQQKWTDKELWIKEMFTEWKQKLINVFRIEKFLERKVQKLSGGQKQSLNILLAFVSKPEFLILDEITTGLDIKAQERILDFIDEYQKETKATLIVVSHILKEIFTLAGRVVILDKHKITADKKREEIGDTSNQIDRWLRAYFLDGKIL